ncbi:hypothetical protein ElyMa_004543200 [Elysia marginata]|uniref:Uncharacterized protein n=1 Tax=Elysia marginata TaxID=1093978 RepID=A0AAV4HPF4_9GAST|nr:hypothetical protein ElyMa_004543200 [Elysia marginata]
MPHKTAGAIKCLYRQFGAAQQTCRPNPGERTGKDQQLHPPDGVTISSRRRDQEEQDILLSMRLFCQAFLKVVVVVGLVVVVVVAAVVVEVA